ncbi:MAG: SRPBCC domain-containing protein [Deltaproteobacteria bacterium]
MEFRAKATIAAPADTVWRIVTKTEDWPEWDPYCDRIEGQVGLGNKLKAYSKLSPGRAFGLKVTELVENEKMTWSGGMPFGLFKGVRTFSLTPRGEQTEFVLHEEFSGPMLGMIKGSIPDMTEAFEAFVNGLKERAEAS